MKIYTKTGDSGQTGLFSGGRVPKNHVRVRVYGVLDEANSALGLALAFFGTPEDPFRADVDRVQNELFQLGSELATPDPSRLKMKLLDESSIQWLEQSIDRMETTLTPLKNFILPVGTPAASAVHVARTIVRRAERELVGLMAENTAENTTKNTTKNTAEQIRELPLQYLNRLSDFLFVLCRALNHAAGKMDVEWKSPKI